MTDRELLELAAKAAGIPIVKCTCSDVRWPFAHDESKSGIYGHWNPLTDDGDALRLAVKLKITPHIDGNMTDAESTAGFFTEAHFYEPYAATRRAITRAAAAIGEAMP